MIYSNYRKTIAFQGSFGANSHLVCSTYFPNSEYKAYSSFEEAIIACEKGEIDLAIIPFENSYAGRVTEIHNLLKKTSSYIVGEFFLDIKHHLCGTSDANISNIKTVISHPQALMQCDKNIKKHNFSKQAYINTANAATKVAKDADKTQAALCTDLAAEINGLKILQENFQDCPDNKTIFVALSKNIETLPDLERKKMTSLLFTVRNIPASIYKSLGGFATNNINIVKLESYIPGGISKEAQFFISFEGSPEERRVQLAMEELGFYTKYLKLLGTYDQAQERDNG